MTVDEIIDQLRVVVGYIMDEGLDIEVQQAIMSDSHDRIRQLARRSHAVMEEAGIQEFRQSYLIAPNYGMEVFDEDEANRRIQILKDELPGQMIVLYEPPGHLESARMPDEFIQKCSRDRQIVSIKDSARSKEDILALQALLTSENFQIHI